MKMLLSFLKKLRPILSRIYPRYGRRIEELVQEEVREAIRDRSRGRQAFSVIVAIVIGILAAYGAILFRFTIGLSHRIFFSNDGYSVDLLLSLSPLKRVLLPTIGGLLVGIIVHRFAPEVKGSGIPEVMEAVAKKGGFIRLRVLITKAVAAALTIGSGGSAGREGPIVHIGSSIGSAVGRSLGLGAKHVRTFVACGAAAAIAATFNAPIAGALFAIEVILSDMSPVSMSGIVISSVIATVISRHHLGDFPAFNVPGYEFVSPLELVFYAALGLFAALIGWLFITLFTEASSKFDKINIHPILKPAIGGFLVGLLALFVPHVFGVGYETINSALWGKSAAGLLLLIMVAKIFATVFTLGAGGSGGIFAPSLVIGACLGASWGFLVHGQFPTLTANPGAYALVGMGAVVSAVTHAPITAILIIFELTNDYQIIPPLMLSCVLAVLVAGWLKRESIYTAKLVARGVSLSYEKDVNLLKTIKVAEVMDDECCVVPADTPFSTVLNALLSGKHSFVTVVDEGGSYMGIVELEDLRTLLPQSETLAPLVRAADLTNAEIPFVMREDNLDLVMHLFGRYKREDLAVCDNSSSKKVVGIVSRSALIDAYNRRIFQEDLTGGFCSIVDRVSRGGTIEVLSGMHMAEIEISPKWIGKDIREADLRKTYGLEVVLVHRESGGGVEGRPGLFPSPDLILAEGDSLLVLGEMDSIQKVREM